MAGTLYIVATPIGNLSDLSERVKDVLISADLLLVEDTRVSAKLLNHLQIKKQMISCHAHNERERLAVLTDAAEKNLNVALLSDAGTPLISDPGDQLVAKAVELGFTIVPISGPSAFLLALVGSGLPCDRFSFEGFLPDKPKDVRDFLISLVKEPRTLVFYVSPHKLERTLAEACLLMGTRKACLARELTKMHEEFLRGTLADIKEQVGRSQPRGEYVLVIEGDRPGSSGEEDASLSAKEYEEYVRLRLEQGDRPSDVAQDAAKLFKRKRSDVYRLVVDFQKERQNRLGECNN
ncbi:MAG: 16S rRNA (cytidine(1402)-2'-O)-methyltransferase [Candidatus Melainabacteria bacterium]|nr:16S rRNA (cytidine(1402)-2'-O)-methyltransferase [Candidatus Melainabacteria bacterium]